LDEILAAASKAIELEPSLAEAHAAKGFALLSVDRRSEAARSFEYALSIDPRCYEAHYYSARYHVVQKSIEQAAVHFIRALEIRPDDYRSPLLLDSVLRQLGQEEERKKYVQLGLQRAEQAVDLHPDSSDPLELGASVLAASGDRDRARDWLKRALKIPSASDGPRYNIVCTYASLGEYDLAIELLEKVVNIAGPDAIQWIKADRDMDPIRDHPRFRQLMQLD
jgi:adenylate cyclase